ncbi:MAG: GNAT family N-acetyltransferase [Chloroflexota bacterium]|nr:GNAT family N-acetyltransferase [Chloroflexota bacterium]
MAIVRRATEADIPVIIELYDELAITTTEVEKGRCPSLDQHQEVFAQMCSLPGHELLVAEHDGRVVGTVVLLIVPNLSHRACPWALAENLIVSQGHRRRGLGRMLMEHAVERARAAGCCRIVLQSDRRREEAHRFYRSLGFEDSALGFRLYF